jgi:hypothetical protein
VLKSIDVLIGLAVVMLALSMAVTVMTQCVISVFNTRGGYLRRGLKDLLGLLSRELGRDQAHAIATAVLKHPLVSATGKRLGSVVQREEFTKLLMHFATADATGLADGAKDALKRALAANGVSAPEEKLKSIRAVALQLEASRPELSASLRQGLAILSEASSDYVAKVNTWFDQTIDRVSQRFAANTRLITFAAGLVLAVVLQVDTVLLVNRLSADDKMREAFLAQGRAMQQAQAGQAAPAAPTDVSGIDRQYLSFLAEYGVISVPRWADWRERWRHVNPVGVLVTGLLLSLGAPFWYNALSRLLQLRSALTQKDDKQRAERQGGPTTGAGGGAAASMAAAAPARPHGESAGLLPAA